MKIKIANFNKIIFVLLVITFILLVHIYNRNVLIETYDLDACGCDNFKVLNINDFSNVNKISEIENCVSTYIEKSGNSQYCNPDNTGHAHDCGYVDFQ